MKVRRFSPSTAAVKEFALALCLILATVLVVVGIAQIYAPAGLIAAGLAVAGLGYVLLTGGEDDASEVPR